MAVARPVNLNINDDTAQLLLRRPEVSAVSVFNLGVNLDKVDIITHASLASGYAFGRIDTLICLNVLGSADPRKRQSDVRNLSRLLTPRGVAYFTRPLTGAAFRRKARVQYFTDIEFKDELKDFFVNPTTVQSSNSNYPIIKCGGLQPL